MKIKKGYCFDDVLLVPKYSPINSRSEINTTVTLPKGIKLQIPIVSANMKYVTGPKMAIAIASMGGLALLHRFDTQENLIRNYIETKESNNGLIGCSVGNKKEDVKLIHSYLSLGCKIICVDVAHAHSQNTILFIKDIVKNFPNILLIVGNVATKEAAECFIKEGVDICKIGIGNGSTCSTRIETGNGYPQLSALEECCIDNNTTLFIADGGIRTGGDCVKALCFADLVMIGNLLAGTDESPGELISINGKKYKKYAGSSTHKTNRIEGVSGLVPYRGPVKDVIQKLVEGIQSGCSYQGVSDLYNLKIDPQFVEISNAGLVESNPHNIIIK